MMEEAKPTYAELEQKVRELEAASARRKQVKASLRVGESRLVDNLKERYFFYSYTPSGELTSVSPSVSTVLGYSQQDFLANFYSYLTDNPCNSVEVVEDASPSSGAENGENQSVSELEIYHQDGSARWFEVMDIPIFDEQGSVVAVDCVANDITVRKTAELSLSEEKKKLEAVFATIGDGLTIMDRDFRIVYQNQIHKEQFGEHLNELCFEIAHNRDEKCVNCPLEECFRDGKVHKREMTKFGESGIQYLELSSGPVRDVGGKIIGGFEIVRNVTDHKLLVSQVIQAQKIESVARLAEGVAHEFNNILTGILSYAELAQEQAPPDTTLKSDLDEIMGLSKRMSDLTRQLLAFSRQETIEKEVLNVNGLLKDLKPMMTSIAGGDVEIVLRFAPDLGVIDADARQVEQIMTKMLVNACHAMPAGGQCTISTANIDFSENDNLAENVDVESGDYVKISISDTGAGMDTETRERIFDPFFTTSGIGSGAPGLGLSSVYGKVKNHGGFIRVFSEVGHGTTFDVYLPRVMAE